MNTNILFSAKHLDQLARQHGSPCSQLGHTPPWYTVSEFYSDVGLCCPYVRSKQEDTQCFWCFNQMVQKQYTSSAVWAVRPQPHWGWKGSHTALNIWTRSQRKVTQKPGVVQSQGHQIPLTPGQPRDFEGVPQGCCSESMGGLFVSGWEGQRNKSSHSKWIFNKRKGRQSAVRGCSGGNELMKWIFSLFFVASALSSLTFNRSPSHCTGWQQDRWTHTHSERQLWWPRKT